VRCLIAASFAALLAAPAVAHDGQAHAPGWTLAAEVTLPLLLTLLLYLAGYARLRARSGRGRGAIDRSAMLFAGGWLILAGAIVSPLHEAGEVSFTMHMIEHELIMLPGALLLIAARPAAALMWGLPRPLQALAVPIVRLGVWRALAAPLIATVLQSLALTAWHVPTLFDRALRYDGWHIAQHLSFVVTALLFWAAMLGRGSDRSAALVSALCLFLTAMVGGGVGALMALDASPWYEGYVALGMTPYGLTPAEDQQLAGLIMWVPGGLFHLAAALVFLERALRSTPERLDHRVARRRQAT
jgi:putative membrane protein